MAIATVNIPLTGKFGYVDQYYPNTVFTIDESGEYKVTPRGGRYYRDGEWHETRYDRYLMVEVGEFPAALKYARLYDVQMTACMFFHSGTSYTATGLSGKLLNGDFDPRTLCWNTKPGLGLTASFHWLSSYLPYGQDAWADVISNASTHTSGHSYITQRTLKKKYFYLYDSSNASYDSYTEPTASANSYIKVKPRLMNGDMPYLTVTYDDEEVVPGEVQLVNKLEGEIDQGIDQTISWQIVQDSTSDWYCMADTWEQTSAVVYWREQGETNWTEIPISGNVTQYTFPARTFGSDKTYEYYVKANDISGGYSETLTQTFTTPGSQVTPQNSPTSGYANPREAITFGWSYNTTSGSVAAGTTIFHWREQGETVWNGITATTGANSLVVSANTFSPLKVYEWYLYGTDTYSYVSQSEVYSFSTSAASITSSPVSPISSIENKNEAIVFEWAYLSNDGMPASESELQYKYSSDVSWTTLHTFSDSSTTYTVPALTFDAGAVEWRVLPYNIDSVLGTAIVGAFISYGAPVAPTVYTDSAPFLTITWQSEEQESYQISVGNDNYGPYFGTEKTFTIPDYLPDGEYTVKVRTMGVYGLWSNWGETDVTIENVEGEEIVLTETHGVDCLLQWATEETATDFRVYRDGKQIGKTDEYEFNDRRVLGEHKYKIIDRLSNGNYSESNEVTITMVVAETEIASLYGGDWLPISYSFKDSSDPQYDDTVETTYSHFYGSRYPSAVISGYAESTMSLSAVFFYNQEEEHEKFKALFGQPVIMKFKDGTVFIGVFDNWSKKGKKGYWTGYTFSLRRVDWEDYVDATQ